jgi:hypothetical protein
MPDSVDHREERSRQFLNVLRQTLRDVRELRNREYYHILRYMENFHENFHEYDRAVDSYVLLFNQTNDVIERMQGLLDDSNMARQRRDMLEHRQRMEQLQRTHLALGHVPEEVQREIQEVFGDRMAEPAEPLQLIEFSFGPNGEHPIDPSKVEKSKKENKLNKFDIMDI